MRKTRLPLLLTALCTVLAVSAATGAATDPAARGQMVLAVGLLSEKDGKPVVTVAPARANALEVAFTRVDGVTNGRRPLSGDLFIALDQAGAPVDAGESAPLESASWSVQAGSYSVEAAARGFAREVSGHWPEIDVRVVPARLADGRTTYRVLAGSFPGREDALSFTRALAAYGMDGAFPVRAAEAAAPALPAAGGRHLVAYSRDLGLVRDIVGVTLLPANGRPSFLLDGRPYRGSLEVRGGGSGIIAINRVGLEDYLLGVVPCELGPDRFPLIEALKAQAVAARTYALRHPGRHRAEGFDLCDTPHCQVYGGASRELPLSSEAVRQTAGLAAWFEGQLAETLYTSTCGGHTEISSDVFRGPAEPYLRGVPCTVDPHRAPVRIEMSRVRAPRAGREAESGIDLGFPLDLLERIGLSLAETDLHRPVTAEEAVTWTRAVTGRPAEPPGEDRPPHGGALARTVCRSLGWSGRLTMLYNPADVEEITGSADQFALAHLLHEQIFTALPNGDAGGTRAMSRGRFAAALARLALYLDPELLADGVLQQGAGEALSLRQGEKTMTLLISREGLGIFERRGTVYRPIEPHRLRSGDRVRIHRDRTGAIDLLVRLPAVDGAAADRYSPYNRWSIVVSREAIEKLLTDNGHRIGRLVNLKPLERGATGRLVRLMAEGTERTVTLRGLDIRWNLGTRENLFFIDRIPGSDGGNRAYRFTGRGWGHGVGLCQVGAVGLAEAGATFDEILHHYYPGIEIRPMQGSEQR